MISVFIYKGVKEKKHLDEVLFFSQPRCNYDLFEMLDYPIKIVS